MIREALVIASATALAGCERIVGLGDVVPIDASTVVADPLYDVVELGPPPGAPPVKVADVNADGRLDVVIESASGLAISMMLATDAMPPTWMSIPDAFPGPQTIQGAFVDIDGDGRLDYVDQGPGSTLACVYINTTPSGSLQPSYGTPTCVDHSPHFAFSVPAVDLDLDGKPDLLLGCYDGVVLAARNTTEPGGTPAFEPSLTLPFTIGGSVVITTAIADLDGDGRADIVTMMSDPMGRTPTIVAAMNRSTTGSLAFDPAIPIRDGYLYNIVDVDGDGRADLIANVAAKDVVLVSTTPAGSSAPTFTESMLPRGPPSLLADVDGDGRPDAIYGGTTLAQALVAYNRTVPGGTIVFAPEIAMAPRTDGGGAASVHPLGDVNGDGKPDFLLLQSVGHDWSLVVLESRP